MTDNNNPTSPSLPDAPELPDDLHLTVPKYEAITGLLEGVDFFRSVQTRLEKLTGNWCVIHIEIERYKLFVDWYGIASGRYLLSHIGEILKRAAANTGCMPGYLGQEQFCLVARYDRVWIDSLYEMLQEQVSSVSTIDGFAPLFGIAMIDGSVNQIMEYYNNAALTAEELRRGLGDRHIKIYDAALHKKNAEEYRILHEFQHALDNGDISFWLQPQYRVSNRKIVGAESLARWRRPDGTMVSPALFVPILEKYDLVTKLDKFIWEAVCRWLRESMDNGRPTVPVSLNISQVDILQEAVPELLHALVQKYDLPKESVKIEITESAYVADANAVRDAVFRLREMGYMVLMDDFGSGYSSLNMLHSLNVDVIKMDAQFLHIGKGELQKGVSILESVMSMAKSLSTPVIMEGVETREEFLYLRDLGCQYIQGFYFNRPMPVAAFEELLSDSSLIDCRGYVFKASQQLHAREFLDGSIYSDAMLNNILGPVAYYTWRGEHVDITRYNDQFFRLVGIKVEEMRDRSSAIERFIFPEDREKFFAVLRFAVEHQVVGGKGVIRVYRPSGELVWLSLLVYYIGGDENEKKFYASAKDVSDLQFLSNDLPGGYYRCTLEDGFAFRFLSQGFLDMVGYTQEEIETLYDNRLINMVHPFDRQVLLQQSQEIAAGNRSVLMPYRIRRKQGDYLFVAEQNRVTTRFGAPCWQCMVVDVTEMIHVRSQMRVLARFFPDSILFLCRTEYVYSEHSDLRYEVALHGLANRLGLGKEEFEEKLNSGEFCRWVDGFRDDLSHQEYTKLFVDSVLAAGGSRSVRISLPDGGKLRLRVRAEHVGDPMSNLEYILMLHEEAE